MLEEKYYFKVKKTEAGKRLDTFLVEKTAPSHSRSAWQSFIEKGKVKVNQKKPVKHYHLKTGDVIEAHPTPLPRPSRLLPERVPLKIVFEDKDFLVVEKPAGIVVHPAVGHRKGTLANALLGHLGFKPYLVHRLDEDTSGLLLVAKNEGAENYFAKQFEKRRVQKEYLALVEGELKPKKGRIELPLGRDRFQRTKVGVLPSGRQSTTEYEVQKFFERGATLVRVFPLTGRTHQIRVHFAKLGHSLVGDNTYGSKKALALAKILGLKRQFLHAAFLRIKDQKGHQRSFSSSLPLELKQALDKLES